MQFLKQSIIALTILLGLATFAQGETSWITKKKDKKEKVEKVEKAENTSTNWIKKKEIKENKEKVKEKIKESKSWITKKSKEKVKDIKDKLKKHKAFDELPKAEFYFAAIIEPNEGEDAKYVYGYVNSDKKSDTFKANNKSYFSRSDGIAYFEDKSNRCEIDSKVGVLFDDIKGKVVLNCKKNLVVTGDFKQTGTEGRGDGETSNGNFVKFKFYTSKTDAVAQLENYKISETQIFERKLTRKNEKKIILKPNGKYYALLIGNSKYDSKKWVNLTSPVNDIDAIKATLDKSYKFEKIIMVKNGTKNQIFEAFNNLSKLTTTNDYVLIYYAGHGQTKAEQAYWIPRDGSGDWWKGDWININELNIFLTEIKAHHLAVMVDSCFVGGKFKGVNRLDMINENDEDRNLFNQNLNDGLNLRSRSVLASGSTGPVSDVAPNSNNSTFALAFLNILKVADQQSVPLNMWNIALNVRNAFAGNFSQKPFYYHPDSWKDGGGDFIFIPKKNLKE